MYLYDEKSDRWINVKNTNEYQQRKRMVRDAWIVVGIAMTLLSTPAMIMLALLATFTSLTFLDEGEYSLEHLE
jgi:hypothetical protein